MALPWAVSCGMDSDYSPPVSIPKVTVVCSTASGAACSGISSYREVRAYWAAGDCSVSALNAGKFVAQGTALIVPSSDCQADTCTDSIAAWYPPFDTTNAITTIASGVYRLCLFVDASGDESVGNSGDFSGTRSGVAVNGGTQVQSLANDALEKIP